MSEGKKEKVREIQTAGEVKIITNHDGKKEYAIFEQVFPKTSIGEPAPTFLYYEQPDGLCQAKASVTESGDNIFIPMKNYPFPKITDRKDYESLDKLYEEIYNFVYDNIDFTDDSLYHIFTSFILMSWRMEDFDTTPYLMFLGDFASGKTRSLEVLSELCYRAIQTSSISTAAIVRLLQKYRSTILLDETDVLNSESKFEVIAIVNSGYKRGSNYIRANPDENDIETWKTFGPKALAGTQDFVKALNSRCIEIPMERATRKIRIRIDRERASELREKLLDYRFKNLFVKLDAIELPFKNGRNHELFTPIIQVSPEKFRSYLINYGLQVEEKRRIEEAVSLEADILKGIIALDKEKLKSADVLDFLVSNQVIPLDLEKVSSKDIQSWKSRIGRVIGNKFHFKQNTKKEFYIDKSALQRLKARYLGSNISDISDISDTLGSVQSIGNIGNIGKSGEASQ